MKELKHALSSFSFLDILDGSLRVINMLYYGGVTYDENYYF